MLECHSSVIDITPDQSLYLAGFANRTAPSAGVHKELSSRCLLLRSEGSTFCLIANDFMEMKKNLVTRIQQSVMGRTGIPVSHIFLHCTHTHSAPIMDGMDLPANQSNNIYQENTIDAIIANAVNTFNEAEEFKACRLKIGKGHSSIGAHRRYLDEALGKIIISSQLNDFRDTLVTVLQFVDNNDNVLVTLINYGCHPVSLGPDSHYVSPDFVGTTKEIVEKKWGGTAIFFNGAAGDINPVGDTSDDIENTNKLGMILGQAVTEVSFNLIQTASAKHQKGISHLPFDVQDVTSTFIEEQKIMKKEENTGFVGWDSRIDRWAIEQTKRVGQPAAKARAIQVGVLRIGSVIMIFSQGELFNSYHKALRERFPDHTIFLAGYTNGESGYLPDEEAFDLGGYEVNQAYIFFNEPSPLHRSADKVFKEDVISLVGQVIGTD